jgi:hypothetical protein
MKLFTCSVRGTESRDQGCVPPQITDLTEATISPFSTAWSHKLLSPSYGLPYFRIHQIHLSEQYKERGGDKGKVEVAHEAATKKERLRYYKVHGVAVQRCVERSRSLPWPVARVGVVPWPMADGGVLKRCRGPHGRRHAVVVPASAGRRRIEGGAVAP